MAVDINPDATLIPDQAEVWIQLKEDVADIATVIPTLASADLEALGWDFVGLVDDKKGIPIDPTIEIKEYDGFGHPVFRTKARKGKVKSGFTIFEDNATTRKIVLPGSASDKVGIPKDVQIYVLYKFVDEDRTQLWVSLRPATAELKSHGGVVDGELSFAEIVVHHTADANRDVFKRVGPSVSKKFTLGIGVTAYTVTVNGDTTASITTLTSAGLQTALRALAGVGVSGVTVSGSGSGPFTAEFTVPVSTVSAAGTGGSVYVE
ncbi:hypothetical protein [Mycobacterium sp. 48b]|uniref:hypothetical protein n=1 Tax=Mycobacterium sp. 48b TaxID=3400426 RepID=UPI003AAFF412